jgi:hypothetical protein
MMDKAQKPVILRNNLKLTMVISSQETNIEERAK